MPDGATYSTTVETHIDRSVVDDRLSQEEVRLSLGGQQYRHALARDYRSLCPMAATRGGFIEHEDDASDTFQTLRQEVEQAVQLPRQQARAQLQAILHRQQYSLMAVEALEFLRSD